jgi:hypothetical protein
MGILVKERMTTTFDLLPESLTPAEAGSRLTAGNYGVVLDKNGAPAALVVAKDLEQAASHGAPSLLHPSAGLPPTVIVGGEVEMQIFAESGAMTLFDVGVRGAVVLGDEGVVGVLPVEAVDEYLGSGEYELPTKTMGPSASVGDTGLGGAHQTPLGRVTCAACGFVNTVFFLDKEHLPTCQNPGRPTHTLSLA